MIESAPARTRARKEIDMPHTDRQVRRDRGETAVFWSWITVLAAGLVYLITIPLAGR